MAFCGGLFFRGFSKNARCGRMRSGRVTNSDYIWALSSAWCGPMLWEAKARPRRPSGLFPKDSGKVRVG